MKIERLTPQSVTYTRAGGRCPFPPSTMEDGELSWSWKSHHATDIELHFSFEKPVFLAAVTVNAKEISRFTLVRVLVNGEISLGEYRAESGKDFGCPATVEIGENVRNFTLCLSPTLTDTVIEGIDFIGVADDQLPLYPTPTAYRSHEGCIRFADVLGVCSDTHADCRFAAGYFADLAADRLGLTVTEGNGLSLAHDDTLPADAYHLEVTEGGAVLRASTRLGLLYGIERLFELEKDGVLPCCTVEDAPYKEMRGVHLYLPEPEQFEFTKSLIKNILIPFHYNQIIIEFAGAMRFDRHPEISEGWLEAKRRSDKGEIPKMPHGSVAGGKLLEKQQVRELCDFARELGFELIPEVQSFGHVQYITFVHPEIAEIDPDQQEAHTDARDADVPPALFYKHSYCPQHPKSYEIIHDLIDEIVEVVRPQRFVHCGHDEIYQLGLCPKCRNIPRDQLYEMHVRDLYDYITKKGLSLMLWGDMVQPVSKYQCYPALDRLPRDIVWLDFIWYFHLTKNTEDNLLCKDYRVMVGNLYSSHFPRYAERMQKDGMLGGQVSFWAKTDEYSIAREGKFFDLMYTAEMLWSADYQERARTAYTDRIATRLPQVRARLRREAPLTVKKPLDFNKEKDMFSFGKISGVIVGKNIDLPVQETTAGLRFTHTTLNREKRVAWGDLVQIGTYTVHYEDGTEVCIPVEYDGNIRCYRYRFAEPLPEPYYRHEGYVCAWYADPFTVGRTPDGTPVTVYAFDWRNPYPEKKIASVTCSESADSAAGIVLFDISLLK